MGQDDGITDDQSLNPELLSSLSESGSELEFTTASGTGASGVLDKKAKIPCQTCFKNTKKLLQQLTFQSTNAKWYT